MNEDEQVEVPAPVPTPDKVLEAAPPAQMSAYMKWLLQSMARQQNPVWAGRIRPPTSYIGATVRPTPRGSRLESSRRKARRSLGPLSGRQWVRASKQIRRAARAQQHKEPSNA